MGRMSWTPTMQQNIEARKYINTYSARVRKAMALDECENLAASLYRRAEKDADQLDTFGMRLLYDIRYPVEQIAYKFGVDFDDIWVDARMMCAKELRFALPKDKYFDVHPYHNKDGVGIEFYATIEWTHKKAMENR